MHGKCNGCQTDFIDVEIYRRTFRLCEACLQAIVKQNMEQASARREIKAASISAAEKSVKMLEKLQGVMSVDFKGGE